MIDLLLLINYIFCALVSQSNTFGYEKKVISEKSTTEADEGHTKSHKDASETPLGTLYYICS